LFCVVGIGGQGKSALGWHWFNSVAPHELTGPRAVDGSLWWSFYESDATYENFILRAAAYVTGSPAGDLRQTPLSECEDLLLRTLDERPFLIVLDGLERILVAYAGMEAAYIQDEEVTQAEQQRRLRQTIDPRAGRFLRKLAAVRASRVLITTRLFPAVLEGPTDQPIHGVYRYDLPGLSDDDALALWRAFEVTGSRDEMLRLFRTFESHPLLIQALAAKVAHDRQHPRDFDAWRTANPHFDPFSLPLTQVKSHILEVALTGLSEHAAYALHVIAAFRMPAGYDTLCALLVGDEQRQFPGQSELIDALADLEDRGLLGWDNRPGVNRYDLHPIVRGVTWSGVPHDAQQAIYGTLQVHFQAMPMVDEEDVNSLEDLTPAIELYDKLIGLERYEDAFAIFRDRLARATLFRLSASRQRVELLERLFPEGTDALPRLSKASDQSWTLNELAGGYHLGGQPAAAVPVLRAKLKINKRENDEAALAVGLRNLSDALRFSGGMRSAESAAREALIIARKREDRFEEGVSLRYGGLALASRVAKDDADAALQRSLRIFEARHIRQSEGYVRAILAEVALWRGDPAAARPLADRAWELAAVDRLERDFIRAARLQGTVALCLAGPGDLEIADERLHHALTRARACNLVEQELPALVALAELHRRRGEPETARELLQDVWDPAERGPYPMLHADGLNLLARIERDAGNPDAAVAAATTAFRLAWCDGPPFAYHWGLAAARKHLTRLGAAEPKLPPFDESQFDPLPEVEINPADEFAE
jgi:tetratricopeptide (TPR) repeat protein